MSEEWYSVRVVPATRIYEFSKGRRRVHREIGDWFKDNGADPHIDYLTQVRKQLVLFKFLNEDTALLFKLTYGGT